MLFRRQEKTGNFLLAGVAAVLAGPFATMSRPRRPFRKSPAKNTYFY